MKLKKIKTINKMKTIDLLLQCDEAISTISNGGSYPALYIELTGVPTTQLDTIDVAKCIDPYTFFQAHGDNEIKEFLKCNFSDWFENE